MGFLLQLHDRVKVLMINVSVNSEQALQNGLSHRHEVLRKGNTCTGEHSILPFQMCCVQAIRMTHREVVMSLGTYFGRKQSLFVQLILNPRHQIINVLGSRALDRLLNVGPVRPMILVSKQKEISGCRRTERNILTPSKLTHLGPADMTGQLSSEQKSVMVPYSIFIWLKKSTAVETTTKLDSPFV